MKTLDVVTKHGPMRVIEEDVWVSRSLSLLGEYSESEVKLVQMFVRTMSRKSPSVFVDAGAYIGDLTIPMAKMCGHVYAFEPQKDVRTILEHNVTANGLKNVTIFPYALGDKCEEITYNLPTDSPGGVQMGVREGTETAMMVTLDSLNLGPVDFIKADVEGMEVPLLHGAQETIAKYFPLLFCEFDTVMTPGMPQLDEVYNLLGYFPYPMAFPMWAADNFNKFKEDIFPNVVSFMKLGIPNITISHE